MDEFAFFLYCAIVSFQFHPGAKGDRLTPLQCCALTWEYVDCWREYSASRGEGGG